MSDHGAICLKTGCLLQIGGDSFWGDLHCLNAATLVFNAVLNEGQAHPVDPADFSPEACTLAYDGPHFERRGVFVLLAHCSAYNEALQAHFARWGGPR